MSEKINMKKLILEQFEKQNSRSGHGIMKNLNPKQIDEFHETIKYLVSEEILTYKENKTDWLFLTEEGYNILYADSINVIQIQELIMEQFKKQNSLIGHALTFKNSNF